MMKHVVDKAAETSSVWESDVPLSQQSSCHASDHFISPNLANFSLGIATFPSGEV